MIKAVLFDLDDTLYDTTLQVKMARENAVKAMTASGLHATEEEALKALLKVVAEKGPNYPRHYDEMLKNLGTDANPKIIASGVIGYHEARSTYLIPSPDTIPTLLSLRDGRYKMAVVTDGVPVKQWEKLLRLGLGDFFHAVVISEDQKEQKPSPKSFLKAAEQLSFAPGECIAVGDRLDKDIAAAKSAGMLSIQIARGKYAMKPAPSRDVEPDYIVTRLGDIIRVLSTLK